MTYRLFTERPSVASFYQKLYKYICVDEAQDLNYSQYCLIKAFCGESYKNVMMVGDPEQSIFGFIGADSKFMRDEFVRDFQPTIIKLDENYRSAKLIVELANKLSPELPVNSISHYTGEVKLRDFSNENDEATWVLEKIKSLLQNGHSEMKGKIKLENIAVLGRNRYVLNKLEVLLSEEKIAFFTKLNNSFESESEFVRVFELGMRLIINPYDVIHLQQLLNLLSPNQEYENFQNNNLENGVELLEKIYPYVNSEWLEHYKVIKDTLANLYVNQYKFSLSIETLNEYARDVWKEHEEILSLILNDLEMWSDKWKYYIRNSSIESRNLVHFRNQISLGYSKDSSAGLALLTIHASKGLEFDIVFIMGMSEGSFPDYRAIKSGKEKLLEEKHNAFVAITRAKIAVYLTYPKEKESFGRVFRNEPSSFLRIMGLI